MRIPTCDRSTPCVRRRLAAATALAVLCLAVGPAPAAAAAPQSPFAGTYWWGAFSATISDGGRVSGSYSFDWCGWGCIHYEGDLRGSVSDDGAMSLHVTESWGSGSRTNPLNRSTYTVSGQATVDADGNLVLVTSQGTTSIWYRQ